MLMQSSYKNEVSLSACFYRALVKEELLKKIRIFNKKLYRIVIHKRDLISTTMGKN
jgi:hypothetical protein